MKKEEYYNFYHVDISNQIENKWNRDSVLAIVKNEMKYSIKIKSSQKEKLKKRFILKTELRREKKQNKRVVAVIYCYLLYKALENFNEANPLLLCRDVRPEILIIQYLHKIANYFGNKEILKKEIKFRKKIEFQTNEKLPESIADKYARKVFQGKLNATKILNDGELEELTMIIQKMIVNRKI
mgnify:CR=1 FL=1